MWILGLKGVNDSWASTCYTVHVATACPNVQAVKLTLFAPSSDHIIIYFAC